jgi:hypothetical protein
MYLLSLSVGGWILFLQMVFLRFVRNVWFSSHPTAMFYALGVYIALTAVFHRIFIVNEHDQKIYNRFASKWNDNTNKKRDLFLALSLAALPYILLVGFKIFLPHN